MKIKLAFIALCGILTIGSWFHFTHKPKIASLPKPNATMQRQTSHLIIFVRNHETQAMCTATPVGPHALMTAEHCDYQNYNELDNDTFTLDLGVNEYHIEKVIRDGHDHQIFLVDGPAFTAIAKYVTRAPKEGEQVFIVGFGGGDFPAHETVGVVTRGPDSDIDSAEGLFYTSMKIIPGDSGSAIYGLDGKLVGLVTYQIKFKGNNEIKNGNFQLKFSDDQLKEVQSFVPITFVHHKKNQKHSFIESLFGGD